ncbi:MAG: hypothetical protein U0174_09265 [Polyangiaceae bacterium]
MALVPCPHCGRHVRVSPRLENTPSERCPFCDRTSDALSATVRSGVLFGAGALALACQGVGCDTQSPTRTMTDASSTVTKAPTPSAKENLQASPPQPTGVAVPAYGVPPPHLRPPG